MSINQGNIQIVFLIAGLSIMFVCSGLHKKVWLRIFGRKQISPHESNLQISFNENGNGYIEDEYVDYGKEIGRQINCRTIRIRVDNLSKSNAIEGVKVLLTDIDKCTSGEKGKLPVRLKLKNNIPPYQGLFTIPIDGKEFIDIIQAYFVVDKRKMCVFNICHIEQKNHHTDIPIQLNAEKTNYKIKIEVNSNTTTCEPKYFTVGLRDNLIKMWSVD